ncbi:alpha/beta hydrolase family protein [Thalassoroseus pseudoceratinae]|uniref:alpha/beta hydrolase family protein n=1 Tax=Thalassoroseus pseudoceratinae TaxID=2713176 RepID=UPI00141F553F|nr:alpha/beta hydrolase family protein [Thalassoroseus pseudoceratinae]
MPRTLIVVFVLVSGSVASRAVVAEQRFNSVPKTGTVVEKPAKNEETAVPDRYRIQESEFKYETEFDRMSGPVRISKVRFPSPITTEVKVNNTVHGDYFQPAGEGPFPGVVMLHILGGEFPLSQSISNGLARRGIAVLFIRLPYYGERRDPKIRRRLISPDIEETVEGMRQAILDIRRAGAWLRSRPEVDANRLGITGISLGGIMTSLAAQAEPRFQNVAIYLAGGGLPAAIWDHPDPKLRKLRENWEAKGLDREAFLKQAAPADPLTYADRLKNRRVLMVAAKHDEVIPPKCADLLHQAIGSHAELVWLESGHISAALFLYSELERLVNFFNADKQVER